MLGGKINHLLFYLIQAEKYYVLLVQNIFCESLICYFVTMLSYVLLAYWDAPRNSGVLPFSFHMFIHGYINCIEALHFHQLYDCNILYLLLKKNLYLLVVTGTLQHEQNSSSHSNGARSYDIWKGHVNPSFPQRSIKKNILFCLEGREAGANWSQTCSNGGHAGRNCERWSPFLEGMLCLFSK